MIFDDGFEYVSHKTDREDSFLSYRIRVTEETKKRIQMMLGSPHTTVFSSIPQFPTNIKNPYSKGCADIVSKGDWRTQRNAVSWMAVSGD